MWAISKREECVRILDLEASLNLTGRCFASALPLSPGGSYPDCLMGIFRMISLEKPSETKIYEALLLSHGFIHAKAVAEKLVSLLHSFNGLLHVTTYSLNSVKAWFADAAERREYIEVGDEGELSQEIEEEMILLAIRDILTPRLNTNQIKLLQHLFTSFYPNVNLNRTIEDDLTMTESRLQVALQSCSDIQRSALFVDPREALVSVLKTSGIEPCVGMIAKLSQLALLLSTQKLVIVTGAAGSGKTACLNTVSQAHREMGTPVAIETIAPQALRSSDLFGCQEGERQVLN
eukprot:sb/3467610/